MQDPSGFENLKGLKTKKNANRKSTTRQLLPYL